MADPSIEAADVPTPALVACELRLTARRNATNDALPGR